jgi:SAM-dependent methyltransferase
MTYSEKLTRREYLSEQYKTKDNLQIRIQTHERFSQPNVAFHDWILDHAVWSGRETVLDVGCGSGMYIEPASERCLRYIAGDLSHGMLRGIAAPLPDKVNLDAESLPFQDASIDVVLANHMLYHVRILAAAVEDISRILRAGGTLIAATNSQTYMPELSELRLHLAHKLGVDGSDLEAETNEVVFGFSLENGRRLLEPSFSHIERFDLPGALVFTESEPLIDYLGSMRGRFESLLPPDTSWKEVADILRAEIDRKIALDGAYRVSKLAGVFVCRKD